MAGMKSSTAQIALTALNLLLALALSLALFAVLRSAPAPTEPEAARAPDADRPSPADEGEGLLAENGDVAVAPPPVERRLPPHEQSDRLVDDLLGRAELIPFDGILGGTMGFYTPDNIYILSNRWVYARFEDGHIGGEMLLEYRIEADGAISWSVLRAELD